MAKFVDAKIFQRRIIMFSKKFNPACSKVKEILNSFNLSSRIFEIVEIESRQDVNEIESYFQVICLTDSREVPQIFIDKKYVGGRKEIMLLYKSGELEKILESIRLEETEFDKVRQEKEELIEKQIEK